MTRTRYDHSTLRQLRPSRHRIRPTPHSLRACPADRLGRQETLLSGAAMTGIDCAHDLNITMQGEEHSIQIDRKTSRMMMVNDDSASIPLITDSLERNGYTNLIRCPDPVVALATLEQQPFDLVLLNLATSPLGVGGLELLREMRRADRLRQVPCILLVSRLDPSTRHSAMELGVSDFLKKPIDPEELLFRIRKTLIRKAQQDSLQSLSRDLQQRMERRAAELVSSQMQLIHCLGRAAEYRDNETGKHVQRVGRFSEILAAELGMGKAAAQQIEMAARLHDIGKLGIPDSILLKPGQLDPEEMAIMQSHAALGSAILSSQPHAIHQSNVQNLYDQYGIGEDIASLFESPLLKLAATIAATHHERWDGSGYPNRLKGTEIPLVGRIVAVADVFDALSTVRPYKPQLPFERCVEMIRSASGTQFDPEVVNAFLEKIPEIRSVYARFRDQQTTG